jgi:type I restriction enzyme S subunit
VNELPPGWTETTIGEITSYVSRGKSPKYTDKSRLPVVNQKAIRWHGIQSEHLKYVHEDQFAQWTPERFIQAGDILWNSTGTGTIGRACLVRAENLDPPKVVDSHVTIVRPSPAAVEPRFLFAWVRGPEVQNGIEDLASGSTNQIELNRSTVVATRVPLAPLAEQKRIGDKLDTLFARVDACRRHLDCVPDILRRFRQSVLDAATSGELTREWREERGTDGDVQSFGLEDSEAIRDFSFPASWSTRRLADIATITGGVTKDSKKQSAKFTELPYLRVANVQRGHLDLSEVKTIRVPPDRVADLLLRAGDILFNEGGDIDKLGRGWIWNDELPACVFQNHVFRARLIDPAFEPRYFSWYGNSRGYEYFLARGKQTTNLASINKSVLSALPVAVPPADEQAEIVRRTNELLEFADHLDRNCADATAKVVALTPSALAKAFRGELVPQDSGDEPASELLAKLKAAQANAEAEPSRRRPRVPGRRPTMSNNDKDAIKAAILKLRNERFTFDELRAQVSGDYESLKTAVFELLEEPNPVVRQVFDKKAKVMHFVRVRL